jgi:hypothetical protein
MITQEELKKLMKYNPDNGHFTRLTHSKTSKARIGDIYGSVNKTRGYISMRIEGKLEEGHRLAWLYMTGSFSTLQIDHINGNRADNRWLNLREVTKTDNRKNSKIASSNTSGITGVTWVHKLNKWILRINDNGKRITIGYYTDLEEAKVARELAKKEYNYGPNHS